MKEKALRDAQITSIHDMGELKRAKALRVDGFSVQKLRQSHATIQELTSQIPELHERVNCMSDSGEFQDIESKYSGKFFHVPSQTAVVPSPRFMLSRDRSMPLGTWNLSGPQRIFFGNPTPYQGILHSTTPSATGAISVARGEERIVSTTTMPMSERRLSTVNSFCQWKFHRILLLASKVHRYRSFSSVNSPHHVHCCIGR